MSNRSQEKPVAAQTNTTFIGVGFYIPFLEKLKLYQGFLRKQSIWEKNKKKYWKQEKIILLWAWSKAHQHLARNLDTRRLTEIYGYSKNENGQFIKIKDPEFEIFKRDELIQKMQQDNFGMLEPLMGNLYLKGFAEVITYEDVANMLKSSEIEELKHEAKRIFRYGLPLAIHSIIINQRGLLMGELVYEEEKGNLWKYRLSLLLFYFSLFIGFLAFVAVSINQIFDMKPSYYINQFLQLVISSPVLAVAFLITILLILVNFWKEL